MSKWKAPEGFVLTRHEAYQINSKGFRAAEGDALMPDGQLHVAHFDEDEPFTANNSPNVQLLPIKDGWVPPVYMLHAEDDPTPVTEPHEGSVA